MSELAHRPAVGGRTRLRPGRQTRLLLLCYGVVAAVGAMAIMSSRAAVAIMTSRSDDVAASIAVLDRGGPPLLASDVPWQPGLSVQHLRPVGVTDDEGIYLWLPLLSKASGQQDPSELMKWLYMGCMGLLVLVFPLLFYEIFGSVAVAVAAPVIALAKFAKVQSMDLYWILVWAMLLGIPALVLAYKWWREGRWRRATVLLVLLMLAESFATSIRINAGLPILIGAVGLVLFAGMSFSTVRRFWRVPRWWLRPALAVLLVLAYLSIATFGFAVARAYRNHVIHQPSFGSTYPTQHPFWHNAYIGLGYTPNKYGIAWNDAVSADVVERAKPGTQFLSTTYESTLRHEYRQLAGEDPGYVARNFWVKARVTLADAVDRFWPVLVLLPLAILAGAYRREMRFALLVSIPAALAGALAPILTVPEIKYELAWLGTWGALFVLTLGWLWVTARDVWNTRWPADLQPLRERPDGAALTSLYDRLRSTRAAWIVLGCAVVTFVFAAVARPAPEPDAFSLYHSNAGALEPASSLVVPAVADWRFAGALPSGWTLGAPAYTQRDHSVAPGPALYVRSTMTESEDDLVGPLVSLAAGKYRVLGSAQALAGGFQVGVRNEAGNAVATGGYSANDDPVGQSMSVPFTLSAPARVRVIVSAWSPFPNASAWVLSQLRLVKG